MVARGSGHEAGIRVHAQCRIEPPCHLWSPYGPARLDTSTHAVGKSSPPQTVEAPQSTLGRHQSSGVSATLIAVRTRSLDKALTPVRSTAPVSMYPSTFLRTLQHALPIPGPIDVAAASTYVLRSANTQPLGIAGIAEIRSTRVVSTKRGSLEKPPRGIARTNRQRSNRHEICAPS
jgi:hypothetical protein